MNRRDAFGESIGLFESATDKDGLHLKMYGVSVRFGAETFSHQFTSTGAVADLRSVSKVVTAMVLGNVIERRISYVGRSISLDTCAIEVLEPVVRSSVSTNWKYVTLRHLMNNTIGHEEGFLFRKDIGDRKEDDFINYIFAAPVPHAPGGHFSYSNVGPFLISVVLEAITGRSLFELAQESVFEPLGISASWRRFGEFTAGSTGLHMSSDDLLKLATVLRDGGKYNRAELVSGAWAAEMRRPISLTPKMYDPSRVFPKYAYGLGLWICENGSFYCDGTNGQYLIVVPERDLAVSTTGEQPDMKPITRCMLPLLT
ncbi:hypothetical protein DNX69_09260 [Rhodopseudomonas palustris]|uniref:Beta-lactamase-related domain-containing protein n=1 Tax=Rhodopseudomonas palustris TaxID=1076 RepID=A0A323UIU5_RHOPL|nr:serine hydrolase [Rhodopseudomonas palustris]PZA12187.1 hypothetical protein DNX69_09260 [Rhodopseudomonas palustris]